MEIMTAEEARQKHNDIILKSILSNVQKNIDKCGSDFFVIIKTKYLTKYIVENLTLAGYKIKTNDNDISFLSWFKKLAGYKIKTNDNGTSFLSWFKKEED